MGTTAQKLQYLVRAKAAIDTALTNKGVTPPTKLGDYGTAIGILGYKDKLQQIINRTVTEITAEDLAGVTSLGYAVFAYCSGLTSVTIGNGVTSIGPYAFRACSSLTSFTIPDSVTIIREYAFYVSTGLTSITIGNGVQSIGSSAFSGCTSLTNITILATTPPVLADANVFNNTNNCPIYVPAESVEAYKAATNWSSLASRIFAIPSLAYSYDTTNNTATVTGIGTITDMDVVIPETVQKDGVTYAVTSIQYQAFYNNTGITSVFIPNSVTSIGYQAFYNCAGLTSVTIGNGVTSIGVEVFKGCSNLTGVTVLAVTPPILSNVDAFGPNAEYPIYVPYGSIMAYATATNWSALESRLVELPE